jgi:hypothetical protein
MFNNSQPVVLSMRQALEGISRATEHFLESATALYGPKCYGDNREPLYCADALMRHMAYLLNDIARGTFEDIPGSDSETFTEPSNLPSGRAPWEAVH